MASNGTTDELKVSNAEPISSFRIRFEICFLLSLKTKYFFFFSEHCQASEIILILKGMHASDIYWSNDYGQKGFFLVTNANSDASFSCFFLTPLHFLPFSSKNSKVW